MSSVAREDRGMYQCFVRNEHEMAQGIAELRLGGKSIYKLDGTFSFFISIFLSNIISNYTLL